MKIYKSGPAVVCVTLLFHLSALAQTSTGAISGVVQDESGAVISGAKVTIMDVDTGISRSVVTEAGGRYHVPSLIPDHYQLRVEMTGFEAGVRNGIQLTVGGELEINLMLKVGQVSQVAEVTAEAPMVETVTGTVSGLVDDKAIRDLPLNGRSYDQLIALESSAPQNRLRDTSGPRGGASGVYAVHGARGQANQFLLDGTEVVDAATTSDLPGGALGINLGVEAIREFSILTSNYGAAYGKKQGAIINVATRSGTNQYHGSAFEFLRNSDLDARNFFDRSIPPFKRNQFGGALGGPIRKDRTFIFGTYEGLRQNLGLSVIEVVPDNNARLGLMPDRQNPGQFINVGLNPAVKPFLAAFPLANGRNFGDGTAEAVFSPSRVSTDNFYMARIDHRLSDKDSLFGRYLFADPQAHTDSDIVYWAERDVSTSHLLTIQETRAYSTTVNTIRAGFLRSTLAVDVLPTIPLDPSLSFLTGDKFLGLIGFQNSSIGAGGGILSGALSPEGSSGTGYWSVINMFSVGDELFHQRGSHSLQMGGQFQRIQNNFHKTASPDGSFQFTDLTSFLTGRPTNFSAPVPNGGADPTKAYRQFYVDGYIQDDWKVYRNFTLNLGVRWEFMTPPTEASGNRISNYHVHIVNGLSVLNDNPTVGSPFYASHKKNFAPRVGFAWDIRGDGKTAVRGGFGMFYDQSGTAFKAQTTRNLPYLGILQVPNPPFPLGFSGGAGRAGVPVAEVVDSALGIPMLWQWNLNIQRQITSNTVFTIAYVGSQGYHLTRRSDLNTTMPQILPGNLRFYPATAPRINPLLGASTVVTADATSVYHGLDVQMMQRLTRGLRYKVSFTYSKNIDTASGDTGGIALGYTNLTMQADNLARDRGLSGFDTRRNLVSNLTYDLPWQNSTRAMARWVGGWQVSGIVTLTDGMPFTALTGFNQSRDKASFVSDRPDLVPGRSNPVSGGPDRYFDPTAFALQTPGFYGNAGRNTMIAPGLANLDLTVAKIIPVRENLKVDFRAEFFNVLNRANFGLPSNTIFNSNGAIQGNAGRISSTVTTSRQIQFGLKLLF